MSGLHSPPRGSGRLPLRLNRGGGLPTSTLCAVCCVLCVGGTGKRRDGRVLGDAGRGYQKTHAVCYSRRAKGRARNRFPHCAGCEGGMELMVRQGREIESMEAA